MSTSPPETTPPLSLADQSRCRTCGYSLRGLPEPRCPECGEKFDPADWKTMDVPERLRPGAKPPATFGEVMGVLSIVATLVAVIGSAADDAFVVLWVLALGCWLGIIAIWWHRNHRSPDDPNRLAEGFRWRPVVVVLMVLSGLAMLHVDSCTCLHAKSVWVGPLGISYSTNGGPCHNKPHNGGKRITGNWYLAYR